MACLVYLLSKCFRSVDDAHALELQVVEIGQCVKDSRPVLAAVGRGTHAVEQHFEGRLLRAHFVKMVGYEDLLEGHLAPLQLGEYRREPLWVFRQKRPPRTISVRDFRQG